MVHSVKYKKEFFEHFKKFPLFTFNDASLFLSERGASKDYMRKMISLMLTRGELYRITKGYYTLNKSMEVVGYAFKPFYYGLGSALNHYNLSKQQANQTIVTTKTVRAGVRTVFGINISIKRIPKNLYFGYRDVVGEQFHFYVSDIEKTLLDMIYFDYVVEDYVYKNIFRRVNSNKMKVYLKKYNDRVKTRYNTLKKAYSST